MHLDVARFPRVRTWGDLVDTLDVLETEPHEYKTAVIDTLDALEPIVWARTTATRLADGGKRVTNIEYGFAKGYIYALDLWRGSPNASTASRSGAEWASCSSRTPHSSP